MTDSLPQLATTSDGSGAARGFRVLDRLGSFRVLYAGFFAFILLDYFTIRAAEVLLRRHFRAVVAQAVQVDPSQGNISSQIAENIDRDVRSSAWVRIGGVRVSVIVLARDGVTPLYLGGRAIAPPPSTSAMQSFRDAESMLPAVTDLSLSLTQDAPLSIGILIGYAFVMLAGLFRYNAALARREAERLSAAISARDATADRAARIEQELAAVRGRLAEVEPIEEDQAEAIEALQRERSSLQEKLAELGRREAALRATAARSSDLESERRTLEEMLEEALGDVTRRDAEIRELQSKLEGASRAAPKESGGRAREADQLGKRLRTLYKNLEIDDRAIDDLVALRDADMKLKAEEAMKRLSDEPDTAAVRRKVGGLPPHLSIFELGFAGKGRIYYTKGEVRRHRVLAVGAKNSQKTDLEYLSRLA